MAAHTHFNVNIADSIGYNETEGAVYRANLVWDTVTMAWVKETQPSGGGGGGSAYVLLSDGADIAQGSLTDAAVLGDSSGTISAKLRGINKSVQALGGLGIGLYDALYQTQTLTQDIWTYQKSGTTLATLTITYTDSGKSTITSVMKT